MGDNAAEEMFVFREFAKACLLPLQIDSASSRNPPEPDILCDLSTGEKLAFEMVEADDVTTNRAKPGESIAVTKYVKDSIKLESAIRDSYGTAVADGRLTNPQRFEHHFVRVHFQDSASVKQSIAAIPDVIAFLETHRTDSQTIKHKAIRSIRCVPFPDRGPYRGPLISVNQSTFNVGLSVVDRIKSKLGKSYVTSYPIHLLVWSSSSIAAEVDFWRDDALALLRSEGMGQFAHLWVFGRSEPSVVFDLAAGVI
jgi:hypothetical protein